MLAVQCASRTELLEKAGSTFFHIFILNLLPSFLYLFLAFISFSVASKTLHYMQRPFKVSQCTRMRPYGAPAFGGGTGGWLQFSVCVNHFVCKLLRCCICVVSLRMGVGRAHKCMHWAPKYIKPPLFKFHLCPSYGTIPSCHVTHVTLYELFTGSPCLRGKSVRVKSKRFMVPNATAACSTLCS